MIQLCYVIIFLSGLTGLIYQVTWQKYLSVLLGSHAAASSVILALFFLFLSLGYAVIGRFAHKIAKNNLALYGGFEFIIGLYALYSPLIFKLLFNSYSQYASASGEQDYFYGLIFCAAFIFIPTFLMGGTLPVLVQALSSNYSVSSKVHARIYAVNTLGAFFGCILAGFYLIEAFGLEDTLLITGWLNLLIGLLAFGIIYQTKQNFEGPAPQAAPAALEGRARLRFFGLSLISFFSGFYVFSLEKLIIRMSGLTYGSSAYTYSIIVGAFILAIGIGSYLLSAYERRLNEKTFILSFLLSIISLFALYLFIPEWTEWALRIRVIFQSSLINFRLYWTVVLLFSLLVLIIPAGLLGMNLPFLFSMIRKEGSELTGVVGRLYSINCLGATFGAVLGGYWFFKFFSADTIFQFAIALLIVSGVIACAILEISTRLRNSALALMIIFFAINLVLPKWDILQFVPGRYLINTVPPSAKDVSELNTGVVKEDVIFSKFDPNTYVTVTKDGVKDRILYVNGKPDAATTGDHSTRALATLNPIALSPRPVKTIFIAGLGAGLSMAVATGFKEVEKVDVAEISEAVKDTLPLFSDFNFDLEKRAGKYNIEVGDAYKVLMSKNEKYDLIVCEPSNPWVAGIEKLFSTEFYEQVRGRLNKGGVFAQWFPFFGIDEPTFLLILNTYSRTFPWVSVWSAGIGAVTILGSDEPLVPNYEMVKSRFLEQKSVYEKFGVHDPLSIYQFQLFTPAQVKLLTLKMKDTQSVFAPSLEFRAGRGYFAGMSVNSSEVIVKKAFLPFPKSLEKETWPLWKEQGLVSNPASFKDFHQLSGAAGTLQSLRLHLLSYDVASIKKEYARQFEGLSEHLYLLGRAELAKDSSGTKLEDRINQLSLKMRQLQAIGYSPAISKITDYVERACKAENKCIEGKLTLLSWFIPPSDWKAEFARYKIENLTVAQKAKVESQYEKIKATYRELGAF